MSQNMTVVSGNKSAIGLESKIIASPFAPAAASEVPCLFMKLRSFVDEATCFGLEELSLGDAYRRLRTLEGKRDDTIAFERNAAPITLALRRVTTVSYQKKVKAMTTKIAATTNAKIMGTFDSKICSNSSVNVIS